jgi:hypothetical protein
MPDAAKRAWNRWKEMRIHSVAPDEMAYGALMRIFAAQGRAEKAVDLLEEVMTQMMMPVSSETVLNGKGLKNEILRSEEGDGEGWYDDREGKRVRVKPTTLLFTSALRAVAKSHEIACRFSGGTSRKNRRRESITSFHGRLARKIVILAEQAEVEQDDGFVSALMLCAATAGDSSTARAIYLASKVRRLDHLRTCGGKDHLKKLQGLIPENDPLVSQGAPSSLTPLRDGNVPALATTVEEEIMKQHKAYEHREYGQDTRILSTLLLAHSKAMQPKGLGSMWAGKYNRGYLCENSLRYIESYNIPRMRNMAIPGITSVEAGLTAEGWEAEDFDDDTKQLRKKNKFRLQQISDDGEGNRIDDMDQMFVGNDPDPDDIRNNNVPLLTGGEKGDWLSRIPRGEPFTDESESDESDDDLVELKDKLISIRNEAALSDEDEEFNKFFMDGMKQLQLSQTNQSSTGANDDDVTADDLDGYINEDEFNKLMEDTMRGMGDDIGEDKDPDEIPGVATNDFSLFRAHLEAELREEGSYSDQGISDREARQLFDMMRSHYTGRSSSDADFFEKDGYQDEEGHSYSLTHGTSSIDAPSTLVSNKMPESQYTGFQPQMKTEPTITGLSTQTMYADDFLEMVSSTDQQARNGLTLSPLENSALSSRTSESAMQMALQKERQLKSVDEEHISELKKLLPGLPISRIEKISDEFAAVLGYPSVLRLALALRENMPDAFGPQCLTRKNLVNAKHLYSEALKSEVVDIHLVNAMLQVHTNSGRIEPAIRFYETEYKNHGMVSDVYLHHFIFYKHVVTHFL